MSWVLITFAEYRGGNFERAQTCSLVEEGARQGPRVIPGKAVLGRHSSEVWKGFFLALLGNLLIFQ